MMTRSQTLWMLSLAFTSLLACGCTRTSSQRIARYTPGTPPATEPVRYSNEYTIQYRLPNKTKSETVDQAGEPVKVVLITGDTVGFRTRGDGTVVALLPYGEEQPLVNVPTNAKDVCFVTRVKKQSSLARSVQTTVRTAAAVGAGTTVFIGDALLNGQGYRAQELDEAQALGFSDMKSYREWLRGNSHEENRSQKH